MDIQKRALLEAALFQASKPLAVEEVAAIIELPSEEVERALEELASELRAEHRGMEIFEVGGRYEMRVKPAHVRRVAHLTQHADLSRGLLKVLSMIIYKQPITQSDIVKTIGNRAYEYVKELEERGLIKTEKYKRSKRIEVTEQFMSYFGIRSRNDLIQMFKERENGEEVVVPEQPQRKKASSEDLAPVAIDWLAELAPAEADGDEEKTETQ